ncbi:MAG: hypothetical protein WCA49_05150 [Candidatus Sulfotelmatobacter sp.]
MRKTLSREGLTLLVLTLTAGVSLATAQAIPGKLTNTVTTQSSNGPCGTSVTTYYAWTFTDPSGGAHTFPEDTITEDNWFRIGNQCKNSFSAFSANEWSSDGLYFLAATGGSGSIEAASGYLNPKYKIMGVTYAPPGGNTNSSVSYADTNFVGNTATNSSSFSNNFTYSISVCGATGSATCSSQGSSGGNMFGFGGGVAVTGSESQSWTQASNSSTTITASKQTTIQLNTPGTPNVYMPVDHDYDIVWVWLNPVALFTIVPTGNSGCTGSKTCLFWNGYGYDYNYPLHIPDVWPVKVGNLNGDFKTASGSPCYATDPTCDPEDAGELSRYWTATETFGSGQSAAINAADLAYICKADPFCPNPGYLVTLEPGVTPPTTTDERFTLAYGATSDFPYPQAGPGSTKGETEIYNQQYSSTTSQSQGGTNTYAQTFGLEEKFNATFFWQELQLDIKQSWTDTWIDSWQNTVTHTNTQTDIATITGPPCPSPTEPCTPLYSQPATFAVYQDNLYGTFMFWPVAYFTIGSVAPATQTVKAGGVTTYSIPSAANAGYTGTLKSFSVTGLPSGATAGFSPSSGVPGFTSTLTVSTATSTPAGTYPLAISATDGSLTYYACADACLSATQPYATLVVSASPGFSVAASPGTQTIGVGAGTTYTVTTTATNGFTGVVDLNVTGLPSNVSAGFSPETITGSGSSTLTITTTGNTPPGTYLLTITGTSGSLTETTTAMLVVTGANFTLSATPEIQSINAGGSAAYTVTTTVLSGFDGVVTLTLSSLPSGASYAFNPTTITGAGSSTLTITTQTSTPAGDYPLSITGTSRSIVQTAPIDLEVNN